MGRTIQYKGLPEAANGPYNTSVPLGFIKRNVNLLKTPLNGTTVTETGSSLVYINK
jgi:hypothetical protein